MKRVLRIVIFTCMLTLIFTISAFAEDVIHRGAHGELSWEFNETTGALTISGTGNMDNAADSYPWQQPTFTIKSVEIGNGITSIGDFAFASIPIESATLPDTLKTLGNGAFINCSFLKNITIPEGVTSIGDRAFEKCYRLESIELPSTLKTIGSDAFLSCQHLTSINIPKEVTSIANNCFKGCNVLESITVDSENTAYKTVNGALCTYDGKTLIAYPKMNTATEFIIPNGVETILERCFENTYLTDITIPASVKYIHDAAFLAGNIENVYIEDLDAWCNVEFVDCFQPTSTPLYNASNLYCDGQLVTKVTIPDGIKNVSSFAFRGYKKLEEVIIPAGVENIYYGAFEGCNSLTRVELPEGLLTIGTDAFKGCSIKVIVIPSTVTAIASFTFYNCATLNAIVLKSDIELERHTYDARDVIIVDGEENLEIIGDYIFVKNSDGKYFLVDYRGDDKNIVLPSYVNGNTYEVCDYALHGVYGITSLTIPEGVTKLQDNFITDITKLEHITFNAISCEPTYDSFHFVPFDGVSRKEGYTLKIGKDVKVIPKYLFYEADITSVEIEEGAALESIGVSAFNGCQNLVEIINHSDFQIELGKGIATNAIEVHNGSSKLKTEGDFVFYISEDTNYLVKYIGENVSTMVLPDSYYGEEYEVWKYAFAGDGSDAFFKYSMIVVPKKVKHIHNYAFPHGQRDHTVYVESPEVAAQLINTGGAGYLIYLGYSVAIDSAITEVPEYITSFYYNDGIEYNGKTYTIYSNHACNWQNNDIDAVECVSDGFSGHKCTICGALKGNTIFAHDYGDATCTEPETCKREGCGKTHGSAKGHEWVGDVCGEPFICDECGEASTKTVEHIFTSYVYNDDATCTVDGTKTAKCDRCDETDTLPYTLGHSFTNYVSDGNATCIADGTKTAKCDRCDETDTVNDDDSELGHSFTNYISNNDATCTVNGTKTAKCDRCDEADTVTDEDSKLGHDFVYVSDGNATCLGDGTKTGDCTRCDEIAYAIDIGSAKGHDYADATCLKPKTCKRQGCNATEGEALGHDYEAATCTEPKTCKREGCGSTEGNALGHKYDNGCDAHCNVCNAERTPASHIWGAPTVTKEATKKEQGENTYTCSVCGETKREAIPMLEGCGGSGGVTAAFITSGGLSLVWFALKRKKI